jgi:hypothetical protein
MKTRTRSLWVASLIFSGMLVLLPVAISVHSNSNHQRKPQRQTWLTLLESSEGPINQGSSAKAIAVSLSDDQSLYAVDRVTEDVVVHETQRRSSRKLRSLAGSQGVESLTVGSEGNIYLADSSSNQIRVMSPAGASVKVIPHRPARSSGRTREWQPGGQFIGGQGPSSSSWPRRIQAWLFWGN